MNPEQNRRYHLLMKECGFDEDEKHELVWQFSDERTTSSTELTPVETTAILKYLQEAHSKRCKPMRGKVIHYLTMLGYTLGNDTPDWDKINAFIEGIGSNNPRRVRLNFLYYSELPKVVTQVEAMYRTESRKVTK